MFINTVLIKRENKLKELAIAYAQLKKEEQDREAESFKKE